MSSLADIFGDLEDKIEDLQRDTKFCLNNYDYHHKNNEYQLLEKMQKILDECAPDAEKFQKNMHKFRDTIEIARKRCLEVDKLLNEFNIKPDHGDRNNTTKSFGHSSSFIEGDVSAEGEDNKENLI